MEGQHEKFDSRWHPAKAYQVVRPYIFSCSNLTCGASFANFGTELRELLNFIDEELKTFRVDAKMLSSGNVADDFSLVQHQDVVLSLCI